VVFKTTAEDNLITDLTHTFANLRHYSWKLNRRNASSVSHPTIF
jgi:hypothetical protein